MKLTDPSVALSGLALVLAFFAGASVGSMDTDSVQAELVVEQEANAKLKEAWALASTRADEEAVRATMLRGVIGSQRKDLAFLEKAKTAWPGPGLAKRDALNELWETVKKLQGETGGPVPVEMLPEEQLERLPTLMEPHKLVTDQLIRPELPSDPPPGASVRLHTLIELYKRVSVQGQKIDHLGLALVRVEQALKDLAK